MPSPKLKICGIKSAEILDYCADLGVDYAGFIYFPPSHRHLEIQEVKNIIDSSKQFNKQKHNRIKTVVVCVNPDVSTISEIYDIIAPDVIQLHGNEELDFIIEINNKYPELAIFKSISIGGEADIKQIAQYQEQKEIIDYLLLDAKPQKGDKLPGGNGRAFDWNIIRNINSDIPIMLSGGLNAANISDGWHIARPEAFDISSGVEDEHRNKSKAKIQEIIAILHDRM